MTAERWLDRQALDALLPLILQVPHSHRRFEMDAATAAAEYQIDGPGLDVLVAAGLPSAAGADGLLFDATDLRNVSVHLDPRSRGRKVLSWWIRELGRPTAHARYRMDYVAQCPEPGHDEPCRWRLAVPDDAWHETTSVQDRGGVLHSVTFDRPRTWPELPTAVLDLLAETRHIRFLWLPETLRADSAFVRDTGIGDCVGVAHLLVEEARRRGLTARFSFGRSLTPPISASHSWAEFQVDGVWVPVDPVLLDALGQWGMAGPEWQRDRSLGAILGRVGPSWRDLVTHAGQPVFARFPTYRDTGG
ncbi:transglutaminase domain-containing protein [Micromonospora echinofusca]|uniref:transglutaminase domain-containing protein n=1 Tax=Micromonospora echinofusca TaxID=47858 RepID=UPI0033C5879E